MESDIAFLAKEMRHAISDSTLKQPMFKIDFLMFEAIRLNAFDGIRFLELRDIYSPSTSTIGKGWTTVLALRWLAENSARLGFPYSRSLPELPEHLGVSFPSRDRLAPHIESLANLLESIAADVEMPEKRMTIGGLIGQVTAIESDEAMGQKYRASITKTPTRGSVEYALFMAALRWEELARAGRNGVHDEPGADRVLAVCRDEFGDALAATLKRLRDRLSVRLECEPSDVAAMSLEEFLVAWNRSPPDDPKREEWSSYWTPAEWQKAWKCSEATWRKHRDAMNPDPHPVSKNRRVRFRRANLQRLGLTEPGAQT